MAERPLKWIEIDLAAIRANLARARRLAGQTPVLAVVKADAYGHGALAVSRAALAAGAAGLGVLTLEEALPLRRAGIRSRILLLSPPPPDQARAVVRERLEPTVDSLALARALSKAAGERRVPVHVDVDYGLGRWGLAPRDVEGFLAALKPLKGVEARGLSTHLDYVPGKNAVEAEEKLRDFGRRAALAKSLFPSLLCHCANSAALLDFPHWKMDMVRVGNLLYGINPGSRSVPLRDPWRLKARIIAVKEIGKGRSIGYASEYLSPRRMRVATVPMGYSDGLTMEPAESLIRLGASFQYHGRLKGQSAPFLGRCGIAHALLDVTQIRSAKVGDAVILPSRRTATSSRIPRIYRG